MKRGLLCLVAALPLLADRQSDDMKRIDAATTTLIEIMHAQDGGIPSDLMQKAHCVGIIPGMKRAGFIVGANYGKGLVTCRTGGRNRWSAPDMVVLSGGSFGLQIGAGETDVVFTIMNQDGENRLMKDKVTIGGEVAAMAGPVGRTVQAQTDALMTAAQMPMALFSFSAGKFSRSSARALVTISRPDMGRSASVPSSGIVSRGVAGSGSSKVNSSSRASGSRMDSSRRSVSIPR